MPKKKPSRRHNPTGHKKARTDQTLLVPNQPPVWSVVKLDVDGRWGWNRVDCQFFLSDILPKMQHFESMTWNEILGPQNHEVSVAKIGKDAKKRLRELQLDDVQSLVSFRLVSKQRLWGIRSRNVFQILWWDPKHEVYPYTLKHT